MPSTLVWAAIFGAAATLSGLSGTFALAMSAIVYSGTAQLAVLKVLHEPITTVFLTSLLVSLRFVPMALALGPRLRIGRWRRALLSPAVVDAAFALASRRESDEGLGRYLLGTAVNGYVFWLLGTLIGVLLGPVVPASWGQAAEGAIVVVFIVLTAELFFSRGAVLAAGLAAILALALALFVPTGLALAVAALVSGLALAAIGERFA